jgi:hypothetical protein
VQCFSFLALHMETEVLNSTTRLAKSIFKHMGLLDRLRNSSFFKALYKKLPKDSIQEEIDAYRYIEL